MSGRRDRSNGKSLWWVRPMKGDVILEDCGHFFVGDAEAMEKHLTALHLRTGVQYAAREEDDD